jgi:hypothetical protein
LEKNENKLSCLERNYQPDEKEMLDDIDDGRIILELKRLMKDYIEIDDDNDNDIKNRSSIPVLPNKELISTSFLCSKYSKLNLIINLGSSNIPLSFKFILLC